MKDLRCDCEDGGRCSTIPRCEAQSWVADAAIEKEIALDVAIGLLRDAETWIDSGYIPAPELKAEIRSFLAKKP